MKLLDQPWPRITELAKAAKRAWIAVAYLNTGARKRLKLDDGDVLVVDMSKKAVASGQTNPHEILAYVNDGVRVFNWPALHAKVYVFDQTLVIGSPNVSDTSQNNLLEAALETNAADAVRQAKAFVRSLMLNRVTPGIAEKACEDWQPPKGGSGGSKKSKGQAPPGIGTCWVTTVYAEDPDEDEAEILERQAEKVKPLLRDAKRYEVETIRSRMSSKWARQVRVGDSVIQIFHESGKVMVYPPVLVLARGSYKVARGKRRATHLEGEREPSPQPWKAFKNHLASIGIKVTKTSHRAIRTLAQRRHVQELFED